ncbi:hypothetical protein NA57DRAFT_60646 [Rhizodiscina lignyota]|uniref:PH domain-containing protein n=1 Tax=Rhizodiscina lignyota TaxID=1504668 RepID=A0A9P4IAA5_9PEZI|nr:hypothetical protein NA57DRAFT_60646 [Rhizodiscina lignyota]
MSTEETKPTTIEAPAVPAVESTPAPAVESTEAPAVTTDAPTTEATTDAPVEATETSAPAAEKKEDKKPAEPIYKGPLSYQVHQSGIEGSIKRFFTVRAVFQGPKKRYFWFGEEAPITTQNLNTYLRGEKPKISHPAAAWSSKTGKGLLYFVKNADDKASPAGVLLLADASDVVESHGMNEFSFKLDGAKHVFHTKTADERSGWVAALKTIVDEAKSMKEEVQNSSEYKDTMTHLNKPVTAGLAATGATTAAKTETPKESTDKPANGATLDKPEEEKKEKKAPKSRSVSRGKRTSIFGNIIGKKEDAEEKKEEKKEEQKADKEEDKKEEAAAAAPAETSGMFPARASSRNWAKRSTAPVVEPKVEEPVAATEAPATENKPEDAKDELTKATPAAGKAGKRGSIFGRFLDGVRSPTTEKKESEVAPTVPPKDEAAKDKDLPAAPTETPVIEEPAATETAPMAIPGAEEKKEEKPEEKKLSSSTPKESFFGKLKGRAEKIRSPSSEVPPATKEPAKEETPAAATEAAPVAETEAKPEETAAVEEPKANGVDKSVEKKEEQADKPRRTSFFGNLGTVKKDKAEGEQKEGPSQKFGGIFRNPSKLIKGQKEGKKASAPAKVDEETKVSDEAPKIEEPKDTGSKQMSDETETKPQNSIGDVVPEAVQVGQPPAATPAVSATA